MESVGSFAKPSWLFCAEFDSFSYVLTSLTLFFRGSVLHILELLVQLKTQSQQKSSGLFIRDVRFSRSNFFLVANSFLSCNCASLGPDVQRQQAFYKMNVSILFNVDRNGEWTSLNF